ncbi:MAG: ABC transporter substrate-binding protein [Deltaproteobacteria bacterium]|nr:ABC transporter substrate-binding protein [Deltaproteobacteria bacterium]
MAEKPTIKVGHLKITDHLILGVTKDRLDKGEIALQHSVIENVPMMGWNQVADALTSGEVDAAFVLAPTAMDIFKSGVGIKLLLFAHKAGSIIVKNKNANIQTVEDFKGKVVLIPYQLSVHNMLFHKVLAEKGLKPGTGKDQGVDVLLEVMAPAMMPESIQYDDEGEIGGYIVAEPIGSQAIAGGYGEEFCLSKEIWPNHPCCVFVVRDDVINANRDAVQELTQQFVQAGMFIEDNPAEAAAIGAAFLGQDQAVVERVLTEPKDRITTNELFPLIDELATMQDYMCDTMGVIKGKIDLEKFVDSSFAKAAGAK